MKFKYQAFDSRGATVSGDIDAADKTEATDLLRRKGLFVSELTALHAGVVKAGGLKGPFGAGRRLRNLAMFSRQMHVLVSSGTPLVSALCAVERQADPGQWREVMKSIRESVEQGSPLSEAMRKFTRYFDPLCLSLVSAGETAGEMPAMLDRLAKLCTKQLKLRSMIVGALIYPSVLIVIGIIVSLTMLMFVLPRFSDLFDQLEAPLPPTTQMLMWVSAMLWGYWWALAPGALCGMAAGLWWSVYAGGKKKCEEACLHLPKIGKVLRSVMTARIARMLGVLLESRVPLLVALRLCRESLSHSRYVALIAQAEETVGRGEPMSAVLSTSELISAPVQEAVRTGEASGRMGGPLVQMADFLDDENDVLITAAAKLIEPAILLTLGVMVGFVAISMFLPLFDLVSAAQKGGH